MGSQTLPKVPVIDFRKEDMKPGSSSWACACMDVQNAFEEYGCFAALYDEVSPNLNNKVMVASEELFDLPTETKVGNVSEMTHFGYLGKKQLPDRLNFESLGIENATLMEGVQTFTNLMWPSGNHHFCTLQNIYVLKTQKRKELGTLTHSQKGGKEREGDRKLVRLPRRSGFLNQVRSLFFLTSFRSKSFKLKT